MSAIVDFVKLFFRDLRSDSGKNYNNVRVAVLPDGTIAFATFRFIEGK